MIARLKMIWRSMPLRLAILLVALFAAVSLLSLAASYAVTQSSFEQSIRADLAQDFAGFRAAPGAGAVAQLIEAESKEADPNRLILSYIAPSGRIFGNGAIARDDEGFHIISLNPDRAEFEGTYLSLTDTLYGGVITIARSRAELVALRAVFVNILLVSLLPTVLIALSGGLILARRSKRHVEVVSLALDRMTSGDLATRVQVGPRWSDDLVAIGGKVNQMAGAQDAQMKALKGVSSDIAHDLKTPLQRVALHLEALEQTPDVTPHVTKLVAQAQQEVTGMNHVFSALLQLAQLEAGSAKSRFETLDLAALCQTVVEVFEPTMSETGHYLSFEAPSGGAKVRGDRTLLGQMVSNLLENAQRHTPAGSHISVTLDVEPHAITLRVMDDGPGIPLGERDQVLHRLYRLDRSRKTPGHGLGLSLVDAVAALHDAQLHLADAKPGLLVKVIFEPQA
ncbi:MAG: ATP-binding protein [Sulfitobacter sp.]